MKSTLSSSERLVQAIASKDKSGRDTAFKAALSEKIAVGLEVRKLAVSAKIFNK